MLVNSKFTASNTTFKGVKSLSWPPRTETRMRLCASSPFSDSALENTKPSSSTTLKVSVINTDSNFIIVQTQGHHCFLISWGPFQPETNAVNNHIRIIHAAPHKLPMFSLQIVNLGQGKWFEGMNSTAQAH